MEAPAGPEPDLHDAPEPPAAPPGPWPPRTGAQSAAQRYLGVLRYPQIRYVWLAQVISQVGDGMMTVALVWYTLKLNPNSAHQGLSLSSILVASTLPYLFGVFTGAFVDRWDRVGTMMVSDISRGVIVLMLPLINAISDVHIWELAAMSFLLGVAGQFFDPAKAALTPSLVPPEELTSANALLTGTRQILFVAGPAIGGSVVALAGALGVFYVDGISFFGSAVVLLLLRNAGRGDRAAIGHRSSGDIMRDIRDGFRYIHRRRTLQAVIVIGAAVNFLLSPLPLLIPLFIKQVAKSGALQFGSLTSVIFVGFLIGAILVALLGNRVGKGRLAGIAILGAGAASAGFALGLPLWPTMGIGVVGGACIGIASISATTIVQEQSANEFRGRVYAFYDSLAQMGRPLSLVIGAFIADAFTVRPVFLLVGLLTMLVGIPVVAIRSLRETR